MNRGRFISELAQASKEHPVKALVVCKSFRECREFMNKYILYLPVEPDYVSWNGHTISYLKGSCIYFKPYKDIAHNISGLCFSHVFLEVPFGFSVKDKEMLETITFIKTRVRLPICNKSQRLLRKDLKTNHSTSLCYIRIKCALNKLGLSG